MIALLLVLATSITISFYIVQIWWKGAGRAPNNKPYSVFGHPDKCIADKIIGLFLQKMLPIRTITNSSCRYDGKDEERIVLNSLREKMRTLSSYHQDCKAFNAAIQKIHSNEFLVGGTIRIPRNSSILSDWGLISREDESLLIQDGQKQEQEAQDEGNVEVELICPSNVIDYTLQDDKSTMNELGYKQMPKNTTLDNLKLCSETPIILWFHGGGMVVGDGKDTCVNFVQSLVENRSKEKKSGSAECPPFLLLSVNYRLAPENPFPSSVIDGLSAASFVLDKYPNSSLHIAGVSAGGNLSAVVGFESFRKFTSRIQSVVSLDPMTLPHVNTTSYYINSRFSPSCPVEFMRWSWDAYLQISNGKEVVDYNSMESLGRRIQTSKWADRSSPLWRLVSPQSDLPPNLNGKDAPTVIVLTSTADPLRDDGLDLVRHLKTDRDAHVHHLEARGSHAMSLLFDPKTKEKLLKSWCDAIWKS